MILEFIQTFKDMRPVVVFLQNCGETSVFTVSEQMNRYALCTLAVLIVLIIPYLLNDDVDPGRSMIVLNRITVGHRSRHDRLSIILDRSLGYTVVDPLSVRVILRQILERVVPVAFFIRFNGRGILLLIVGVKRQLDGIRTQAILVIRVVPDLFHRNLHHVYSVGEYSLLLFLRDNRSGCAFRCRCITDARCLADGVSDVSRQILSRLALPVLQLERCLAGGEFHIAEGSVQRLVAQLDGESELVIRNLGTGYDLLNGQVACRAVHDSPVLLKRDLGLFRHLLEEAVMSGPVLIIGCSYILVAVQQHVLFRIGDQVIAPEFKSVNGRGFAVRVRSDGQFIIVVIILRAIPTGLIGQCKVIISILGPPAPVIMSDQRQRLAVIGKNPMNFRLRGFFAFCRLRHLRSNLLCRPL